MNADVDTTHAVNFAIDVVPCTIKRDGDLASLLQQMNVRGVNVLDTPQNVILIHRYIEIMHRGLFCLN